ncbi:VWA domain-containing protein [Spiroplasma alleghenense]|uniref:Two-component regulator system yiem receptor component protein n=1 Tax=Spiroplasma alleghenense TaxID=216931 RepID=A0A345Z4E0_9MOLU|nr:VWA domain-containing protein [Spiroplasma alleghenense]AXK51469.1 two-component regulator system yiem receptor component protein [Spiroplasma alleghenense]
MVNLKQRLEGEISNQLINEISNYQKQWFKQEYYKDFFEASNQSEKKIMKEVFEAQFGNYQIFVDRFLSELKVKNDINYIEKMGAANFEYNKNQTQEFLNKNESYFKEDFQILPSLYKESVMEDWVSSLINFAFTDIFKKIENEFKMKIKQYFDNYYREIENYTQKAKKLAYDYLDKKVYFLKTLPEYNDYIFHLNGKENILLSRKIRELIVGFFNHWTKIISQIKPNEKIVNNIKVIEKNISQNHFIDDSTIDLTLTQIVDLFEPNKLAVEKELEKISLEEGKKDNFDSIIEILESDIYDEFLSEIFIYINEGANKLAREIKADINGFVSFIDTTQPVRDIYGPSWGMDFTKVSAKEIELMIKLSEEIKNNLVLQRLFEILGKLSGAKQEFDKSRLQKSFEKKQKIEEQNYPEEILGMKLSSDIDRIFASELAYLKSPALKKLFMVKYLEQKFQTFDYKNTETMDENELSRIKKQRSLSQEQKRGPIILIIDISGSMHGTPELISKATAIIMSALANRNRRSIYLITFSTDINWLDLTAMHSDVKLLYDFLSKNFSDGGTDFSTPLQKAIEIMQTDEYRNADVLMISDFLGEEIPESIFQEIKKFQVERKNRFHALVLSKSPNMGILKNFSAVWNLDPEDLNNYKKTLRKMSQIAEF